jgi:hypothetical protein
MPLLLTAEISFFFHKSFPFLFGKGEKPGIINIHGVRIPFSLSRLINEWPLCSFLSSSNKIASLFEGIFSMFSSDSSLPTFEGV